MFFFGGHFLTTENFMQGLTVTFHVIFSPLEKGCTCVFKINGKNVYNLCV